MAVTAFTVLRVSFSARVSSKLSKMAKKKFNLINLKGSMFGA